MSIQSRLDKVLSELQVSRLEVIDNTGRAYQRWDIKLDKIEIQDDGRTLKVFIYDKKELKND